MTMKFYKSWSGTKVTHKLKEKKNEIKKDGNNRTVIYKRFSVLQTRIDKNKITNIKTVLQMQLEYMNCKRYMTHGTESMKSRVRLVTLGVSFLKELKNVGKNEQIA